MVHKSKIQQHVMITSARVVIPPATPWHNICQNTPAIDHTNVVIPSTTSWYNICQHNQQVACHLPQWLFHTPLFDTTFAKTHHSWLYHLPLLTMWLFHQPHYASFHQWHLVYGYMVEEDFP